MFNRDWLSNVVLAVSVVILISVAIAFRHYAGGHEELGADLYTVDKQATGSNAKPASQVKLENPRIYQPRCQAPESSEEANLCIQRELADTARETADLAWRQMLIGALGFGAVVLTLLVSAVATWAAARAVTIAKVSERAWLSIEGFALSSPLVNSPEGIRSDLVIDILNTGQSPAANVHIDVRVCAQNWQAMDELRTLAEAARAPAPRHWRRAMMGETIAVGRPAVRQISLLLGTAAVLESRRSLAPLTWVVPSIVGCLTYRSAFDRALHQTGFIFDLRHQPAGAATMLAFDTDTAGALVAGPIPQSELRIFQTMISGFVT